MNLKYDEPESNFAFNVNLRPSITAAALLAASTSGERAREDAM